MRKAPTFLIELLILKIDYHEIYRCLPWFLFWPYDINRFIFLRGQCVFSHEHCWFLPKYSWIITLQYISISSGTIGIFIQTSVISSDKSVTLKKKLRRKIRFARLKVAQVILMISKPKQGDLQKWRIVLHSFQTSRALFWLEHIETLYAVLSIRK